MNVFFKAVCLSLLPALFYSTAFAEKFEIDGGLRLDQTIGTSHTSPVFLASLPGAQYAVSTTEVVVETPPEVEWDDSEGLSLTAKENIHKFLGLGAILAGIMAGGILPEDDDESTGTHHNLAMTATGLGIGAAVTGFLFHSGYIDLDEGVFDTYNLHALAGLVGTMGYLASVSGAPQKNHASAGMAGALCMGLAVAIVW